MEGTAAGDAKGRPRRVVVARDFGELWLGVVEDGRVVELSIRPEIGGRWLGTIVKGRVTRLAPGVRAAFVDIGLSRDVFTVMPPGTIAERHLMPGEEILVQISREAQGGKGHRGTFEVTLPGWALVLAPGQFHRGVSRRIADAAERERLRAILDEIAPERYGLIARTAAAGLSREELVADRDALIARWEAIDAAARGSRAPAIIWREENQALAFVRDHLAIGIDELVVDEAGRDAIQPLLAGMNGSTAPAVRIHPGPLPAIEGWALDAALAEALSTDVSLPGGGRLVIQSTEALVAIDVNSGRDTGAADLEDTALRTNLEAAEEVARQVRLRDLAGLVVIDFIDVEHATSRARINEALATAFAPDRLKSRILPLTEFCLAQITRQRRRLPVEKIVAEPCSCCGRGLTLRPEAEARRLLREARRRIRPLPHARVRVTAPEHVATAAREIVEKWGAASGLPPSRVGCAVGPTGIVVD